jgi:hypothetical protein
METVQRIQITAQQLAHMGGGVVAYIREIASTEALKMLGPKMEVPKDAKLFCLYGADGTPLSISGSRDAALANAFEHELKAVSVH